MKTLTTMTVEEKNSKMIIITINRLDITKTAMKRDGIYKDIFSIFSNRKNNSEIGSDKCIFYYDNIFVAGKDLFKLKEGIVEMNTKMEGRRCFRFYASTIYIYYENTYEN